MSTPEALKELADEVDARWTRGEEGYEDVQRAFLRCAELAYELGCGSDWAKLKQSAVEDNAAGDWTEHHLHVNPSPDCHLCQKGK